MAEKRSQLEEKTDFVEDVDKLQPSPPAEKKPKEARPSKDVVLEYTGPAARIKHVGMLAPGSFVSAGQIAIVASVMRTTEEKVIADLCKRKAFRRVTR